MANLLKLVGGRLTSEWSSRMMSNSEEMLPSTATLRPLDKYVLLILILNQLLILSQECNINFLSPSDSAKGPKNSTLTIIALPPVWAAHMLSQKVTQQSIHRLRTIVD